MTEKYRITDEPFNDNKVMIKSMGLEDIVIIEKSDIDCVISELEKYND